MEFVPYSELGTRPNIIVDGAGQDATVLTLSHWPKSGTPAALKRDTSAEIAFAYLDLPEFHVDADAVSNNHFDEDGLIAMFTLLQPDFARAHRALLTDAASAGDFGVYADPRAARIAFTIGAFTDPDSSPLDPAIFALDYEARTAEFYRALLERLADIVDDTDACREYWEAPDALLQATHHALSGGSIGLREQPELDLAVAHIPAPAAAGVRAPVMDALCHPWAVHSRTQRNRILLVCGRSYEFRYRYESWVQMVSHRPLPRVDLAPLEEALNQAEASGGRWLADDVADITPRLCLEGAPASSIPETEFTGMLEEHLRSAPAAWDPYD